MNGIKHTVECSCVLPQYKNKTKVTFHKFVVFSVIDNNDKLEHSYEQCNNCGIIHKVIDLCKSKILVGKENLRSITTVDDIRLSIPDSVGDILENYNCDLAAWRQALFIIEHQKWGEAIVIDREKIDNQYHGKFLVFESFHKFLIKPFRENGDML